MADLCLTKKARVIVTEKCGRVPHNGIACLPSED